MGKAVGSRKSSTTLAMTITMGEEREKSAEKESKRGSVG